MKAFLVKVCKQWPMAIVLVGVAIGLAFVASEHWRLGSTGIGATMIVGGFLRFLPRSRAGMLALRRRWVDITLMFVIGMGILFVAWIVPPARIN